ncbi:related to C6 transcription factor [Cephalotrichum gorgonifer]|uniref:Related to C6 transcription factor n=1 Tax=Cephalotrichum gorgonifer TaxID=2041049 RepID=A0AAE8MYX8_9PEZI|nr:related to C6 transcription factor [Cephalotrichum gorgonifer]
MSMQDPNAVHHQSGVPSAASPYSSSSKRQRVLACIACQQRKVKCDRKFPCANCVRSRVQCVPATLVPRTRKRRFPERELLDRLRHYEDLLRRNNVNFEPLHKEHPTTSTSPNTESGYDSAQEHADPRPRPGSTRASDSKEPAEKVSYQPKTYWQALRHQGDLDYESDSSAEAEPQTAVMKMWDQIYQHREHFLFGSRVENLDLSTLHPGPAEIFRHWQIYLDNVNPLLNVTHAPSLQPRVIEAASNLAGISPALEALMFAIYCMSIRSLSPSECEATFHASRDDLLLSYQFGCQQALMNCGLLRTNNRECLTAYYLYLMSMAYSTHPQSLYIMLSMAMRIAERMGIHNESSLARCSPFEAEMRRRLWWSLVLFDSRIGEKSEKGGAKHSSLSPAWDCKTPLNISDSDLRPEMKTPLVAEGRCTEAIFSVVRSQLSDYLRHTDFYLNFTNPILKHIARSTRPGSGDPSGERLDLLEKEIEDKYTKFCDPTNPIQFLTIVTTKTFFARCRLLRHLSGYAGPDRPVLSEKELDAATSYAICMLETDTAVTGSPSTKGYQWFMASYFPLPAYLQIALDVRARPLGPLAGRAWGALSDNFAARIVSPLGHGAAPYTHMTKSILLAWDAYEAALIKQGHPKESITLPGIVAQIRRTPTELTSPPPPVSTEATPPSDIDMSFDDFQTTSFPMLFGGFPDTLGQYPFLGMEDATGLNTAPPQLAMGNLDINGFTWASTEQ